MTIDEAIAKMEVFHPEPGDVIAIECDGRRSDDELQRIADMAMHIFQGMDVRVMILHGGAHVRVIRQKDAQDILDGAEVREGKP